MGRLLLRQCVLPDNINFILQQCLWPNPDCVEHVKEETMGNIIGQSEQGNIA